MSEKAQGFEEYTPSRLEWLVTMLNSHVQYINTIPDQPAIYLFMVGGNDGNTIIMRMRHFADIPPESVEGFADGGRNFAISVAKSYKWDSWLEIQTQLEPIERPPQKT